MDCARWRLLAPWRCRSQTSSSSRTDTRPAQDMGLAVTKWRARNTASCASSSGLMIFKLLTPSRRWIRCMIRHHLAARRHARSRQSRIRPAPCCGAAFADKCAMLNGTSSHRSAEQSPGFLGAPAQVWTTSRCYRRHGKRCLSACCDQHATTICGPDQGRIKYRSIWGGTGAGLQKPGYIRKPRRTFEDAVAP